MKHKLLFALAVFAFASCSAAESIAEDQTRKEPPKGSCKPDYIDCLPDGYCLDYWWCERNPIEEGEHKGKADKGTWMTNTCDTVAGPENMYWNPTPKNGTSSCDYWDNLDQVTRKIYNDDKLCIKPHCEFRSDPDNDCSSSYFYFNPKRNDGKCVKFECPRLNSKRKLLWSQEKKSCLPCDRVKYMRDGTDTSCCLYEKSKKNTEF